MDQESLVTQIATLAIENSATSIVVTDPVGILLYVNPYFERMTGYKMAEVGGRPCSFLQYAPNGTREEQPGLAALRTAIHNGHACTTRLINYRKSGEKFVNELTISPLYDGQREVIGFVGVQQDITERVRGEQAQLEAAITQHAMEMLREIFGDFNHELRHPLSRIGVAAHLARKQALGQSSQQVAETTRTIEQEISIMRTLLDRFGRLQKLYTYDRHEPRKAAFVDVVDAEITIFQGRNPDVIIEKCYEDNLPPLWLNVDEIGLMVRELLDNMTVHNPNLPKRISIHVSHTSQHLIARFSNNGPQISDDDVEHLFRPFFRGDRSRTADATRVGLGLSLAARAAEIHYGRLYLEQTTPEGSTFAVQFPVGMPTLELKNVTPTETVNGVLTQEIERLRAWGND